MNKLGKTWNSCGKPCMEFLGFIDGFIDGFSKLFVQFGWGKAWDWTFAEFLLDHKNAMDPANTGMIVKSYEYN